MSAHKNIDKICVSIVAVTLILALLFCNGKAFGIETNARTLGYENRLFDNTKVHNIDIVIDDWDSFIETCESEEYSVCNVVIDGELIKKVGIRGKGNTSLSSVRNMGSSRYSFKIEFDQYDKTKSYHGLDKLCLNNIIQDNTYMKDYLAYTLMKGFGVDAPLCSFVYIKVNGEEWGLYLAVEAIEDSFLERNYGSNYGDLYKPDSMSFGGGGPGNGKNFSMTGFINQNTSDEDEEGSDDNSEDEKSDSTGNNSWENMFPSMEEGDFDPSNIPNMDFGDFDLSNVPNMDFGEFDPSNIPNMNPGENKEESGSGSSTKSRSGFGGGGFGGFGGGFGMGSDDVKLKYIDDDPDSYSNIFNNAKTTVNKADENRLISSLKALSEQSDIENAVDVDEVIRYFVVHIFLCNGDSYTGSMIHNYYLYEKDGQLSMIPWDYNLAYGSFSGGNASSSVNSAIDTPVSGDMSDRPMVSWIFDNEEYTEMYHKYFQEFLNSVDLTKMIEDTAALIDEYVKKDPTKFCTYEEFLTGVEAIKQFCKLRSESVQGQLDGSIPSTSAGQSADSSSLIDTNGLNTSDMGSMGGNGNGGFGGGNRGDFSRNSDESKGKPDGMSRKSLDGTMESNASYDQDEKTVEISSTDYQNVKTEVTNDTLNKSTVYAASLSERSTGTNMSNNQRGFGGNTSGGKPEGFDSSQFGGNMPEGFDSSQFGGNMPGNFDPSQFGGNMPGNFDPSQFGGNMPEGFDSSQFGGNIPEEFDSSQFGNGKSFESDSSDKETSDNGASDKEKNEPGASENSASADSSGRQSSERGGVKSSSFTGFGGSAQNNDSTEYILLGSSAFILLLGVLFAAFYKRRK